MQSIEVDPASLIPARAQAAQGWRNEAACALVDLNVFFPLNDHEPSLVEELTAKAYCHDCPVRRSCLDWAVSSGQEYGIFGGRTSAERLATRRSTGLLPGFSH